MKDNISDEELDQSFNAGTPMRDSGVLDRHWKPLKDKPEWEKKPKPRDFIINDLIVSGKVAMLAGHGGRGKTWALTQLAISVATGRPWFDHEPYKVNKKGKVLLALGEEDEEELHRRIYNVRKALDLTSQQNEDLINNIIAIPLAGTQVTLLDGENYTDFYKDLESRTVNDQLRLVILDPLSRFAASETETDNKAATTFITALERLTRGASKPAVVIAHHERKPNSDKNSSQFGVRGSSGLVDGVRWVGRLGPAEDPTDLSLVKFSVVKTNYTGHPPPLELERREGTGGCLFPRQAAGPGRLGVKRYDRS